MYLFIAYKEDSSDYCKGCLMARYSADHVIENMLTAERLAEIWATYLHKNMNLECNESGYAFWIFNNGIKVFDANMPDWDGWVDGWDEWPAHVEAEEKRLEAQEQKDRAEIKELYEKAKVLADKKQQDQKDEEQRKLIEKRLAREAQDKELRRRQFEALQKEFKE